MREYGQIQCAFWTDPDIQGVSDQAKLLAAYLLTGPHSNGIGCYRLPDGYIQADFGWSSETISKGFAELFRIGFANRCLSTQFVLIPKFLRWNPVSNGNVAIARTKEFEGVSKKSAVFRDLCLSMLEYGNHWPNPFKTLLEGYAKQEPTLPNPEREPDPEKNQPGKKRHVEQQSLDGLGADPATDGDHGGKSSTSQAAVVRKVFEHWQQVLNHPRAKLDDKRKRAIKARLENGYTADDLCKAIDGCKRSPYHMGENEDRTIYDDIELICRDAPHVDRFIHLACESATVVSLSSAGRQTASAAQEWLEQAPKAGEA